MKSIIFCFLICALLFSCIPLDVSNSKWEYKINEESVSFIEFNSDSTYVEYDAEIGEHLYGVYSIYKDQIILNQTRGEFDEEFPKGSKHKTKLESYIMVLKNKDQLGFAEKWKSNKWEDDYFFQRVK